MIRTHTVECLAGKGHPKFIAEYPDTACPICLSQLFNETPAETKVDLLNDPKARSTAWLLMASIKDTWKLLTELERISGVESEEYDDIARDIASQCVDTIGYEAIDTFLTRIAEPAPVIIVDRYYVVQGSNPAKYPKIERRYVGSDEDSFIHDLLEKDGAAKVEVYRLDNGTFQWHNIWTRDWMDTE